MLHLTAKRKGGDLGLNIIKRCITATNNNIRKIFGLPHHRSQTAARLERLISDARYTVRYRHRSQAAAISERSPSDARYGVRDDNVASGSRRACQ